MCLYIEQDAVAAIAEEDIEVYKVLRYYPKSKRYFSPFRSYEYSVGNNPPVIHSSTMKTFDFEIGYQRDSDDSPYFWQKHTAVIALSVSVRAGTVGKFNVKIVEEGLHTFSNLDDAKKYAVSDVSVLDVVVRCIIPKGSEYYKGIWPNGFHPSDTYSSYASSQLIVLEVIDVVEDL